MPAVRPGYDEIGAQTLVLTAKQQFRVGHREVIGVSRIEVDYRRIDAVATAAFCGRVSHCTLPATPLIERGLPTHPLAGLRAATLFVVPQWPANGVTLL
jgi:hypothetical protein